MNKKKITIGNGEEIAYIEKGSGDQVILLVHGNFSSSLHYLPLFEKLPEHVRTIALDLRGFGDSSYYRRIESLKDFAEDIHLFLQKLAIREVLLVGWSLGGGVTMEFAAAYPKMVNRMILMNSTTHRGYPVFKKDAQGQFLIGQVYESAEALGKDPIQVIPLLEAIKNNNFQVMDYIWNLTIYTAGKPDKEMNKIWINESLKQRNLIDADWALANLNMSNQHNFYNAGTNNIGNIKCNVLHIWGEKDIVVPEYMILENIKAMQELSTYKKYENCAHSPLVDQLDKLINDVIEFFNL
jgi:pimeloyl-ACP methyl ester carboxylesterase